LIAIGPAVPVSRRSQLGIAARANIKQALAVGGYDIVHGFEPALPSLSQVALLEATSFTVATFCSPDRVAYPGTRALRDRLRARVDVLLATSGEAASAADDRFPGTYTLVPAGVDIDLFSPATKRRLIVAHVETAGRQFARAAIRALDELPDWELILLHTAPLTVRPSVPHRLRDRVHVRTGKRQEVRAALFGEAAIFVPGPGDSRLSIEASAAGCAIADPPASDDQPELVTAAVARLAADPSHLATEQTASRSRAERATFDALTDELETVYTRLVSRRRPLATVSQHGASDDSILVDLHMHTHWSSDCAIETLDLLDHAEAIGLGAIAITDHNVFGGAREALELAVGRELLVIPGEEVKTDSQGEVIGLYLSEEIPRGMTFSETVTAIKDQDGVVYLPHPFDRMHAIPDPATLHRHLDDIDVFEVYNARLMREAFNDEALRFARKYGLRQGAGSDAHVLQGLGTGVLRMRRFEGRDDFLAALRDAEVIRRPRSLAYLQSLKWVAQVKEKVR
jgi:predicted metal-dependent phosphoesterase TrpH